MKDEDLTIRKIVHAGYDEHGNWHGVNPIVDPRPEEERGDDGMGAIHGVSNVLRIYAYLFTIGFLCWLTYEGAKKWILQ